MSEMLNGKRDNFSRFFYFLPSTTDRKKEINQHLNNVSLHVKDCVYDNFRNLSPSEFDFISFELNFGDERRKVAEEIVLMFLKEAVEISN